MTSHACLHAELDATAAAAAACADFCVVEPRNPKPGAPSLVLVHGFGAFGDQWRYNLAPLADAGYRVFAPTLPGFGRSEKAALQYSQDAWRDFIRWAAAAGLLVSVHLELGPYLRSRLISPCLQTPCFSPMLSRFCMHA
jgi:pimeloyl-ACP methyl ester carboxylesterase